MDTPLTAQELIDICQSPAAAEAYSSASGCAYLVVQTDPCLDVLQLDQLPQCPVIGWNPANRAEPSRVVDLVLDDPQTLATVTSRITAQPVASTTLIQLLRHNATVLENLTPASARSAGLLAESLAYSSLQHSHGFQNWLAQRPAAKPAKTKKTAKAAKTERTANTQVVLAERQADQLVITLNRPEVHNAFNEAMKAALCELLQLAACDPSIHTVQLQGRGASFCAGGDLSEFGLATDAGVAHTSRTTRHAGALLAGLDSHTSAILHGACIGAGIEVPAFARHVTAHPQTTFRLPEVAMGLVPGAGGTVSVLRRIGRQRTAYMALSNAPIDATTALGWGLIDSLTEP